MDYMLVNYIRDNYGHMLVDVITTAHRIMMDFDPNYDSLPYLNILSVSDDDDPQSVKFAILQQTRDDSIRITKAHGITLADDVELQEINLINKGLYDMQYLEEFMNIPDLLLSSLSNEEKMIYTLEAVTNTDNAIIAELITEVDDNAIDGLAVFIDERMSLLSVGVSDQVTLTERAVALLHKLQTKSKWQYLLGLEILESGVPAGFPFDLYMEYVHDYFKVNPPVSVDFIAINILSVLYLTKTGVVSPVTLFNDVGPLLLEDKPTRDAVASKINFLHET